MCRAATVLRLRVVLHPRIGSVSRQLGSSVTDLPGPARSSPSARQRPHRTVPMHRSRRAARVRAPVRLPCSPLDLPRCPLVNTR
jgi:hypothetical protein